MSVFEDAPRLCKDAPGTTGCLERPMFEPFPAGTLEPGKHVFEAAVKDRVGTIVKLIFYTMPAEVVHFQ